MLLNDRMSPRDDDSAGKPDREQTDESLRVEREKVDDAEEDGVAIGDAVLSNGHAFITEDVEPPV